MPRPTAPSTGFTKPTYETRYYIDYEWWKRANRDLRTYMSQHLCDDHRAALAEDPDIDTFVDWIDPKTGQVSRVDKMNYTLLAHCSQQPDYITERTSLIDGVFRTLLAVSNRPTTITQLAEQTRRPADTLLRTLSGQTVYNGIRPARED